MRRSAGAAVAVCLGLTAGVLLAGRARRWMDAVEVHGRSMAPALLPGDRLLVEARSFGLRSPRVGEVVLAPDPRSPQRELIKRVAVVDLEAATADLLGDDPDHSTDSRAFGTVPLNSIRWRVAYRYWPPARAGRL